MSQYVSEFEFPYLFDHFRFCGKNSDLLYFCSRYKIKFGKSKFVPAQKAYVSRITTVMSFKIFNNKFG